MRSSLAATVADRVVRTTARTREVPDLMRRLRPIRGRVRYMVNAARREPRLARYTLRDSGMPVFMRHHTADSVAFKEIFVSGLYDPPEEVAEILRRQTRPLRIVDLGAHVGLFGVYARATYKDVAIDSVEPDPSNLAVLRRTVEAQPGGGPWTVHAGCAWDSDGTVQFRAVPRVGISSHVVAGDEPGTVSVPALDALRLAEGADLVKMDIEGSEWRILADERFARLRVPVYVFEYHPLGCPDDDPRATAERLFQAAGYRTRFIADQGHGIGMFWAVAADDREQRVDDGPAPAAEARGA